jgi:hypothetical protein
MRLTLITAVLLLASCTTAEHIKENPILLDQMTARSSADVAQCFTEHYRERPWRVTSRSSGDLREVVLQFETDTVKPVVAVLDITDSGSERRVIARARRMDAPQIKDVVSSCL